MVTYVIWAGVISISFSAGFLTGLIFVANGMDENGTDLVVNADGSNTEEEKS